MKEKELIIIIINVIAFVSIANTTFFVQFLLPFCAIKSEKPFFNQLVSFPSVCHLPAALAPLL